MEGMEYKIKQKKTLVEMANFATIPDSDTDRIHHWHDLGVYRRRSTRTE